MIGQSVAVLFFLAGIYCTVQSQITTYLTSTVLYCTVHVCRKVFRFLCSKGPELNQIATDDADSKNNHANEDVQDITNDFLKHDEKQQNDLKTMSLFTRAY